VVPAAKGEEGRCGGQSGQQAAQHSAAQPLESKELQLILTKDPGQIDMNT